MTDRDDLRAHARGGHPLSAVAEAKHAARARALSARSALSPATRERASADAALRVMDLPGLQQAVVVLAYFALPAEIDPLGIVRALRSRGVKIAYPRVESPGVLVAHLVDDELDLVPGPFGLTQPREQAPPAALPLIDAVIIPATAFDVRGMRLGYGGGYYDRLLPRLRPDCLRVGLAFDEQLFAEIPAEKHDAMVDMLVTQTRTIRPAGRRIG